MKKIHIALIILLLISTKTFAQIEGDVRSRDDNRISKAVIIAIDSANNRIDSVMSKEDGFYSFINLKPGIYLIEARARGFEITQYKNVIARKKVKNPAVGNDISNATRLQIVLIPIKKEKQ
jgi:Carboxypeptidase regulatory-like domain